MTTACRAINTTGWGTYEGRGQVEELLAGLDGLEGPLAPDQTLDFVLNYFQFLHTASE
jgi:hypothetical protein